MKPLLTYLFEALVCSGALWAAYCLLLERRVHFRWCRIYLLAAPLLASLIPLLHIPVWPGEVITLTPSAPVVFEGEWVADPIVEQPLLTPERLAAAAYGIGILLALVLVIGQLLHIRRLRRNAQISRESAYRIVRTKPKIAAFSFFRSIYVWEQTPQTELQAIVAHETSHITHGHTVERIVMEGFRALLWWNPFVHLIARRLTEVEEFEADSDVLDSGYDLSSYMEIIFRQLLGYSPDIANGLRDSLTKKRFKMMTTRKTGRHALLRLLATVPVLAGLLCAFSFTTRAATVVPAEEKGQQTGKTNYTAAYLLNGKEVTADVIRGIEVQEPKGLTGQEIPEELRDRNLDFVFSFTTDGEPRKIELIDIEGRVLNFDGTPAAGTIVYAGHNYTGPTNDAETERLCVKTDAEGRYRAKGPKKGAIYYKSSDGCAGMHSYNSNGISPYTARDIRCAKPNEAAQTSAQVKELIAADSTADKKPLYIVDGVERSFSHVEDVIEHAKTFTIIKSKSAVEKYGERGRNGVIIITTDKNAEKTATLRPVEMFEGVAAKSATEVDDDDDMPYLITETMPGFQGGNLNDFRTWVQSQIRYPAAALENNIRGRVTVSFIIEKDGSVSSPKILQTPDNSLSEEVIRILNSSPKWTPGKQGETIVRVKYTLPVDFRTGEQAPTVAAASPDEPLLMADQMPIFQGGDLNAFRTWAQSHVRYPAAAQENNIQGRVIAAFIIEKDGSLSSPKIIQSPDNSLSEEVLRILNASPKWTPGMQGGTVVRVKLLLPIDFLLAGSKAPSAEAQKPAGSLEEIVVVGFGTKPKN